MSLTVGFLKLSRKLLKQGKPTTPRTVPRIHSVDLEMIKSGKERSNLNGPVWTVSGEVAERPGGALGQGLRRAGCCVRTRAGCIAHGGLRPSLYLWVCLEYFITFKKKYLN